MDLQSPGQMHLSGTARLTFIGFDVYNARLWISPEFRRNDFLRGAFRLELDYLRDFEGSGIADRSMQEMQRVANLSEVQARRWLAFMKQAFPDVKRGDRLTGVWRPGEPVRFFHNSRLTGELDDMAFARHFFGIWLAPETSQPALRRALLGKAAS